ncbi:MAG: S8 family peptidase, partial [Actinobacteria bacterium]|nr:S8 family peptidase [Actinomycetota bacterium]
VDRVDQRFRPLDNTLQANNDGDGVHVYVLDTGIRGSHSGFGGRVLPGPNFVNDGRTTDCNGHGTHVAGIVGGSTYGVAKAVTLVPVRTLNCSGSASTSTVIAAIDWVTDNAQKPAVANMSLGGSSNSALDLAVQKAIGSGVAFSIAAGNGNFFGFAANACNTSPARVRTPGAMTIGATDANDAKASFSNYGDCVDWFAPGVNIVSSWYTSDTATRSLSGTSMAAPYTAGVAALYLDAHPGATPAQVESGLLDLSQQSALATNSRTTAVHSHIVFTGRGGTGEVL